jgi:hypothetical protein
VFAAQLLFQAAQTPERHWFLVGWLRRGAVSPMQPFAERKIDAFFGTPPEPQESGARKIGRVGTGANP